MAIKDRFVVQLIRLSGLSHQPVDHVHDVDVLQVVIDRLIVNLSEQLRNTHRDVPWQLDAREARERHRAQLRAKLGELCAIELRTSPPRDDQAEPGKLSAIELRTSPPRDDDDDDDLPF